MRISTPLLGEWTEWINLHHPGGADGDRESFEDANATVAVCPGGESAMGIYCKTVDDRWWNETGQVGHSADNGP